MSEKRCKKCHTKFNEGDTYCLFCGTRRGDEQEVIKEETTDSKLKDPKFMFVSSMIVGIIFVLIGIGFRSYLFFSVGLFPIVKFFSDKYFKTQDEGRTKTYKFLRALLFTFLIFSTSVQLNLLHQNDYQTYEENDISEIESEYETLETLTEEEIISRIRNHFEMINVGIFNIEVKPVDNRFIVNLEVVLLKDRFEVGYLTKIIVDKISRENDTNVYIQELNVRFLNVGEVFAKTSLYNLYLVDVVDLENDGEYYDKQSGMTVLFKTSQDRFFDFTLDNEELDMDTETHTIYVQEFEEWNNEFMSLMDKLYNQFNDANHKFDDDRYRPSDSVIQELDFLTQQLGSSCESFNNLKPSYNYEVFNQGFNQACQFFHKSYVKNLDGLKNKSVKEIQDSFIDYQIGYDWISKIYNALDEDVESSDA